MDLKVLAVPDCPNVVLLERRLAQATEGRRDVTVSRQVIADQDQADRWGMHGSPTILVDGTDPFAEEGEPASLSCRLYRDGNGQVDGAPSVSQLRRAIGEAGTPMDDEVIAILHVADAATAVAWYERLGFSKEWEYRFDPDCPAFVSIARGRARLFLSEHRGDARPDTLVGLFVRDIDPIVAEFGRPEEEPPYGCEFELRDPDGNRLRIRTRAT